LIHKRFDEESPIEESPIESFFFEADKEKRRIATVKEQLDANKVPAIQWKNSHARLLLYHGDLESELEF
jgi:hypothetical protein